MQLPQFDLRSADGSPFDWNPYWQRRNLVLLVAHDGCDACAQAAAELREGAGALADDHAVALIVSPSANGDIVDPDQHVATALGVQQGTLVAVDRFFVVLGTNDAHEPGAVEAALDRVDLAEL